MGSHAAQHSGHNQSSDLPSSSERGETGPYFRPIREEGTRMSRILIVDDHAFIRRGVRGILQDFPEWEVCGETDNGKDAVRLAQELKPEVILMDVSMPGITGLEAARTIRGSDPQVKIILLTLHDSRELVRSAFQSGVNGYLLKNDAEQELIRALTVVIADGTYVSPKIDAEFLKHTIAPHGNSGGDAAE
jgi:DNA-binding NarL/FixJ family response regulator